jgi:hypothetical protein
MLLAAFLSSKSRAVEAESELLHASVAKQRGVKVTEDVLNG